LVSLEGGQKPERESTGRGHQTRRVYIRFGFEFACQVN